MSEKDKVYGMDSPIQPNETSTFVKATDMEISQNSNNFDFRIYNELDDFAAEVLEGKKLVNYINTRREYFFEPKEAIFNTFGEEESGEMIKTFSDFYYQYLAKKADSFLYKFMSKGYTEGLKKLVEKKGIDPNELDVNWESIKSKEEKYEESLIDILYAILNYELKAYGMEIFGINMGYESTLYFIIPEKSFLRLNRESELFTIFDIGFLETIYNEIYEVTGDLGIKNVEIGDFIEKKDDNEYHTLFADSSKNCIIKDIDEDDETMVKIIL